VLLLAPPAAVKRAQASAAAGPSPDVARLIANEGAFARLSARQGMRAAFLAYMADDAVIFRPGPVPARAFVEARPSPNIELLWAPAAAAVAASGDLGYTTGPYEVRGTDAGHPLEGQGFFVTIWRKQADGSWKFALDQGVETPPLPAADAAVVAAVQAGALDAAGGKTGGAEAGAKGSEAPGGGGAGASPAGGAPSAASPEAVLAADREFAGDAVAHGARAAYMGALAPDARLYRDDAAPVLGREAIGRALAAGPQVASSWQPTAGGISAAGDLGYTYGNTALMGPGAPRRVQQAAVYLRIWQREKGGRFKIVLDLVKPLPPPPVPKPAEPPAPGAPPR
jgi:ketosteroid isomerase-like protein